MFFIPPKERPSRQPVGMVFHYAFCLEVLALIIAAARATMMEASSSFAIFSKVSEEPSGKQQGGNIGRTLEAGAFGADIVGHEHIEILFLKFLGTVFDDIRRLGGKTDQDLMGFTLPRP